MRQVNLGAMVFAVAALLQASSASVGAAPDGAATLRAQTGALRKRIANIQTLAQQCLDAIDAEQPPTWRASNVPLMNALEGVLPDSVAVAKGFASVDPYYVLAAGKDMDQLRAEVTKIAGMASGAVVTLRWSAGVMEAWPQKGNDMLKFDRTKVIKGLREVYEPWTKLEIQSAFLR